MSDAEIYGRLNAVERSQAVDGKRIDTLEKDLPKMEERLEERLDKIEAWAGRIFWALAVGAVGIIGHLGLYWINDQKHDHRQEITISKGAE